MPAAGREQVVRGIRTDLIADRDAIARHTPEALGRICRALARLGEPDRAAETCGAWMGVSDNWRTVPLAAICELSPFWANPPKAMPSTQPVQAMAGEAVRARLVDRLTNEYFVRPSKLVLAGPRVWFFLSVGAGPQLPAETRALWAGKLREAFVELPGTIGSMKGKELACLAGALKNLGDQATSGLVADWARQGAPGLASLSTEDISWLAGEVSGQDEAAKAARQRLAHEVTSKCLTDAGAVRAIGPQVWKTLANIFSGDLTDADRAKWVAKVPEAFGGASGDGKDPRQRGAGPPGGAELSGGELGDIDEAVRKVGGGDRMCPAAVQIAGGDAWRGWDPNSLVMLSGMLGRAGDQGQAGQGRIVEHLTAKFLGSAGDVGKLTPGQWRGLASSLGGGLPPEARALWADRLRAGLRGPVAARGSRQAVDDFVNVMAALGDKQAAGVAASFIRESAAWQTWNGADLGWLAGRLAETKDAGKEARLLLARHASGKCLAKGADARALGTAAWRDLAAALAGDLSDAERNDWAVKIAAAFGGDAKDLESLNRWNLYELSKTMETLGQDGKGTELVARVVRQLKAWQDWGAEDMAWLAARLDKAGEAAAGPCRTVMARFEAKYLTDAAAAKTVQPGQWNGSIGMLAKMVPAEAKARWIGTIQSAHAGTKLDCGSFCDMVTAVGALGGPEAMAKWMDACPVWQSWVGEDLASLCDRLGDLGKDAAGIRRTVAAHVTERVLGEAKVARSVSPWQWGRMVFRLKGDVSPQTRAAWVAKLREAFLADLTSIKDRGSLDLLVGALGGLDDKDPRSIIPAFMAGTGAWLTWKPNEVAWLAEQLQGPAQAAKAGRDRIVQHVTKEYLTDGKAVAAVDVGTWCRLCRALGKDLTPEARGSWLNSLRAAFGQDLPAWKDRWPLDAFVGALAALEDAQARAVVPGYMDAASAWKSWKGDDLAWLAQQLAGDKPALRAKRQVLGDHLVSTFLREAAATRLLSPQQWSALAGSLADGIPAEQRTAWALALRRGFVDGAEALASLKDPGSLQALSQGLVSLKDAQADDVAAKYVVGCDGWQSWASQQQAELSQTLAKLGPAGGAARKRQIQHVEGKYLASPAATKEVPTQHWRELARAFAADLTAEAKANWLRKITSAFAGTVELLAALNAGQVGELADAATALGGQEKGTNIVLSAVTQSAAWKSWDAMSLRWLADAASKAGEAGKASRLAIIEHLGRTYFADPKVTRTIVPFEWRVLTGQLAADMSAGRQAEWNAGLRRAYIEDPEGLAGLKSWFDLNDVTTALGSLGDKLAGGVASTFVEHSTVWQSWNLGDLSLLADRLGSLAEAGKGSRAVLIRYLADKYLADAQATRSVGTGEWSGLCRSLAKDLPAETRKQWAGLLRAAFLADAGALNGLKDKGAVDALASALRELGDAQAWDTALAVTKGSNGWRSWNATDWLWLAQQLGTDPNSQPAKAGKQVLIAHVADKYLGDPVATRSVSCENWNNVAICLGGDLPPAKRAQWAGAVRDAFTKDKDGLACLKQRQALMSLIWALEKLKDPQPDGIVVRFAQGSVDWQSWNPEDLVWLGQVLAKLGPAGVTSRQRLIQHVEAKHLADATATKAVAPAYWRDLARSLAKDLSADGKAQWATRVIQAFSGSPELLSALKLVGLQELFDTAVALDNQDKGTNLVLAVVSQSTEWKAWDAVALCWLAGVAVKAGDAGNAARQAIAGQVAAKYLADGAAARSAGTGGWKGLTGQLAAGLPPAQRTQWADGIRRAYLKDAEGPASLKGWMSLDELVTALSSLGDKQAGGAALDFVASSTAWQLWNPGDLSWLAGKLAAVGDAAKPGRQRLAQYVAGKYLVDVKTVVSVGSGTWKGLSDGLGKDMPQAARKQWIAALRGAFLADLAAVKDKGLLDDVIAALGSLGDEQAQAVIAELASVSPAWRSWSPADVGWLAERLGTLGDAGKAGRQAVAQHVSSKYLVDDKTAASVGAGMWKSFCGSLGGDLTPATRKEWISRIRAALVADLAAVKDKELLDDVTTALGALRDEQAAGLVAEFTTATTAWHSWNSGELGWLADRLSYLGGAGKAARKQLADHVARKYLADPKATASVSPETWSLLARSLTGELSPENRKTWIAGLRGVFLTDLSAMKDKRVLDSAITALTALGDKGTGKDFIAFMDACPAWQTWQTGELVWLAERLSWDPNSQPAKAKRQAIAGHVAAKYLANRAAVRSVSWQDWSGIAASLAADLPPKERADWAGKLRQAFVADPNGLGLLKFKMDVDYLIGALGKLKDPQPEGVVATYVGACNAWQSWGAADQVWLAERLAGLGEAGAPGRKLMVEHLTASRLASAEGTKSLSPGQWRVLAGALCGELSAAAKGQWIAMLKAAFAGSKLKGDEFGELVTATASLGDAAALATWMEASSTWKTWDAGDLVGLSDAVAKAGKAAAGAQAKLIAHVEATYLTDAKATGSVSTGDWSAFASSLKDGLPPEAKARWAAKLRAAFLGTDAVHGKAALESLVKALDALGDKQAAGATVAFMGGSKTWRLWTSDDLAWLAINLGSLGDAGKPCRQQVAAHLMANRLAEKSTTQAVACANWRALADCLSGDMSGADRAQWASRLRAAFLDDAAARKKLSPTDLGSLVDALRAVKDGQADAVVATFVVREPTWQTWRPGELAFLAGQLAKVPGDAKPARERLLGHIRTVLLTDADKTRSVSCQDWRELAAAAAAWVPAGASKDWARKLEVAFIEDRQALAKLKMNEVMELTEAIRSLDSSRASVALAAWIARARQ
jgi:uncharacterized protein CbrC (UPF0167 family)